MILHSSFIDEYDSQPINQDQGSFLNDFLAMVTANYNITCSTLALSKEE